MSMTTEVLAIAGGALGVGIGLGAGILKDDVRGHLRRAQRAAIDRAAPGLNSESAQRWSEEWLAEHAALDDVPLRQLLWTLDLVVNRHRMRAVQAESSSSPAFPVHLVALVQIPSASPNRVVPIRPICLAHGTLLVRNYLPQSVELRVSGRHRRVVLDDVDANDFDLNDAQGTLPDVSGGVAWQWLPLDAASGGG